MLFDLSIFLRWDCWLGSSVSDCVVNILHVVGSIGPNGIEDRIGDVFIGGVLIGGVLIGGIRLRSVRQRLLQQGLDLRSVARGVVSEDRSGNLAGVAIDAKVEFPPCTPLLLPVDALLPLSFPVNFQAVESMTRCTFSSSDPSSLGPGVSLGLWVSMSWISMSRSPCRFERVV